MKERARLCPAITSGKNFVSVEDGFPDAAAAAVLRWAVVFDRYRNLHTEETASSECLAAALAQTGQTALLRLEYFKGLS